MAVGVRSLRQAQRKQRRSDDSSGHYLAYPHGPHLRS